MVTGITKVTEWSIEIELLGIYAHLKGSIYKNYGTFGLSSKC